MNKTVKTIAWICLVLGLLGTAVDAGVVLYGQQMRNQAREAFEAGEIPATGRRFNDANKDGEINREDLEGKDSDRENRSSLGEMLEGRSGSARFLNSLRLSRGMRSSSFGRSGLGSLALMFISGPILAVIGAVILIVNREPKAVEVVEQKEKKAKSKKA
jgi:hypothetical protein